MIYLYVPALGILDDPIRPIIEPLPTIKTEESMYCDCEQELDNGNSGAPVHRDEQLTEQMIDLENAVQNAIFVRYVDH